MDPDANLIELRVLVEEAEAERQRRLNSPDKRFRNLAKAVIEHN